MDKVSFVYNKDTYNAYDAQQIVFEACKFQSEIIFADGNKRGNAKSFIGLYDYRGRGGFEKGCKRNGGIYVPFIRYFYERKSIRNTYGGICTFASSYGI